ncbi:hypothetical protein [Micromonospora aurantiaca (nom. illeg.)]|uniref:hypothetical protein n=1 Tax=Micromonospora aurantiaca (nom. illeg.) TaxID=47850 RepID=UPI0037AF54A5
MSGAEREVEKKKPTPLRGLLVALVILLIFPATRDMLFTLGAWILGALAGVLIAIFVLLKPRR